MRKAKRILSLVLCLAMVIMTVPALSLTALAASESATVGDGSNNFTGTLYSSSNINGYLMNVPSKFGKSAEDVVYDITYKAATESETQLQIGSKKNATYFSMDVAFTSADEKITFQFLPHLTADSTSSSNYIQVTLSSAGVTAQNYTGVDGKVPAFELNKWYNIAFVDGADGTKNCTYLYVNGVGYKLTQSTIPASYGSYRSRMKFVGNSGRLFADNVVMEDNATGENAYDPSKYVVDVSVADATKATLSGNTLSVVAGGVTAGDLATVLTVPEGSVIKAYAYNDTAYTTPLGAEAVLGAGDVVIVKNANDAFRYYDVAEMKSVSSTATVYDGVNAFGTFYSSAKISLSSNQTGVYAKPATDKIYKVNEKASVTATANMVDANSTSDPAMITFDAAWQDSTAQLYFYSWGRDANATSTDDYYGMTIDATGTVSFSDKYVGVEPAIPAFNLGEWYNFAWVSHADGKNYTSLYINGVEYKVKRAGKATYGVHRFRVEFPAAGSGVIYLDNIVKDQHATGDYKYNPAIHAIGDIATTHADVSVKQGDLVVNNLDFTVADLKAAIAPGRNDAVLYTDRTYTAEVSDDTALLSTVAEAAVLVYSNGFGAYKYYDIVVTDEADATGINTGATAPTEQNSEAATPNVPGTGMKTADDVVISLDATPSYEGIRFDSVDVMEMSLQAPEEGYISLNSLAYTKEDQSEYPQWYYFQLTNDGFYKCSWNGAKSEKIADAEAGRWYNVAVDLPDKGTKNAAKLYIDGVAYNITWPFGSDGNFYGTRRSMLFCSSGTAYVDNIRGAASYSTKYELPAEVAGVEDSGVTVLAEDKAIMFEDELTVSDLIDKLSINERAHAVVRVYEDGTFATKLEDADVVNDGAVVVVAAKNGYQFERVYSYYNVNPALNTTIFDYAVIDEEAKTAKITGFLEKNITEETDVANIVIPAEIMGYSVVEIGAKAFFAETGYSEYNKDIRTVVIPEGVTTIGDDAFRWNAGGNGKITAVTIPDSVTSIGTRAFYNLAGVTSLNLSDNLKTIGASAFYNVGFTGEVIIPASVTSIGSAAFALTDMSYFEFEAGIGISAIPNEMFRGASNLKTLVIPAEITSAGTNVFVDDQWSTTSTNITIYGADNSFAETFAAENNRVFVRSIDDILVIGGALKGDGTKTLNGTNYDINYGFETIDYAGTIKNIGDDDKVLKAVVVLFDGNDKMLARVEDEVIVFAGEEVNLADEAASLAVDGVADGYKVKAFLWDAASYAPVSDGVEVEFDIDSKELHLLTIGNSFTNDSKSHLGDVFKANDVTLKTTTLYIGSSTLKDHYDNMLADKAAYDGKKIGDSLLADKWDVVTVQAATHGQVDYNNRSVLMKYGTDEADAVFEGVKEYIAERAPEAKRVMHMTWVPCDEEAVKMYGAQFEDRAAALAGIKAGYEYASNIISSEDGMMIPTYYAVEALVAQGVPFHSGEGTLDSGIIHYKNPTEMSIFRDETCHMTYDGYGAPYGRVLASLTWFEYLTGIDARTSNYTHPEISEEEMNILEAAAHDAQQYVTPLNLWGQN